MKSRRSLSWTTLGRRADVGADQRLRRPASGRRLTRRGRYTLLAIALVVGFGLGFSARQLAVDSIARVAAWAPLAGSAAGSSSLPDIASASRPGGKAADAPGRLPSALFSRLPVAAHDYGSTLSEAVGSDPSTSARFVEHVPGIGGVGPLEVEYSFDAELTRRILKQLKRGRVERGHIIVLDPRSGRVLAYVSTDADRFPPDRSYPAASLIKVVTAAAALHYAPSEAREPCVYRGNQYRLSRSRLAKPKYGNRASLERALATSNNQCFAQLAVHTVGSDALLAAIDSFGWLEAPAPGHAPGTVERGDDEYDLGRLGCGLSGCRITPLHAAQLAATLATGERVTPWWIDRVLDANGRSLPLPPREPPRRVMSEELTTELRGMLVRTTTHGTARSAFRNRRGRPKLGQVRVAGKTGNITGSDPRGRYEWFIGAAPASDPTIAIAVLQLQSNLWWARSSQLAADVLSQIFCERGHCSEQLADQFTGDLRGATAPILLSASDDG